MRIEITAASGGSASGALAANTVAIGNGVSSLPVTYSGTIAAGLYPVITIVNITDATPIDLQAEVTAASTTGFTALFNAPTDTANYLLSYIVMGVV